MKYTRKQIEESIRHWEKVLESMNEAEDSVQAREDDAFKSSCKKALKGLLKSLADLEMLHTDKTFDNMPAGFKKDVDSLIKMMRKAETLETACK